MRPAEAIDDRRLRIVSHPGGADEMRVPGLLHDVGRSGGPHHVHCLALSVVDQLSIVVVEAECGPSNRQTETVFFLR